MPSTVKIVVMRARNLPRMDRQSNLADAFVTIRLGKSKKEKTSVSAKSQNPVWNEDFRLEVPDDITMQDEAVEIKVWDKNYSADVAIGVVLIDLNCLLMNDSPGSISGWLPIYDTTSLSSIRGHLKVSVKVQFFGDVNPFKDSAAGLQYLGVSSLEGYTIKEICGFVEELLVADDAKYQWMDSLRSSRKSNELKQLLLNQQINAAQRNVGRKALAMGANAVLGLSNQLDLEEGCKLITVRAYGTAVRLVKNTTHREDRTRHDKLASTRDVLPPPVSMPVPTPTDEAKAGGPAMSPSWQTETLLSLDEFPSNVQISFGGLVAARAVKLFTRGNAKQKVRDQWWAQLRNEVMSHARSLNCTQVVGYTETTSIFEDIAVLSAYGTAARVAWYRPLVASGLSPAVPHSPPTGQKPIRVPPLLLSPASNNRHGSVPREDTVGALKVTTTRRRGCAVFHIPYTRSSAPFQMQLAPCLMCGKKLVPQLLLTTTQMHHQGKFGCPIVGTGKLIEARVCRAKPKAEREEEATLVNEAIPFMEYDLHRQLVYKLRLMGMNTVFKLSLQISVGENLIVGVATGTAVYSAALPPPPLLHIRRYIGVEDAEDAYLVRIQRRLTLIGEDNMRKRQRELVAWMRHRQTLCLTARARPVIQPRQLFPRNKHEFPTQRSRATSEGDDPFTAVPLLRPLSPPAHSNIVSALEDPRRAHETIQIHDQQHTHCADPSSTPANTNTDPSSKFDPSSASSSASSLLSSSSSASALLSSSSSSSSSSAVLTILSTFPSLVTSAAAAGITSTRTPATTTNASDAQADVDVDVGADGGVGVAASLVPVVDDASGASGSALMGAHEAESHAGPTSSAPATTAGTVSPSTDASTAHGPNRSKPTDTEVPDNGKGSDREPHGSLDGEEAKLTASAKEGARVDSTALDPLPGLQSPLSVSSSSPSPLTHGLRLPPAARLSRGSTDSFLDPSSESEAGSEILDMDGYQPERNFVLQIDDEADEDMMAVLLEPCTTAEINFCSTEDMPGAGACDVCAAHTHKGYAASAFSVNSDQRPGGQKARGGEGEEREKVKMEATTHTRLLGNNTHLVCMVKRMRWQEISDQQGRQKQKQKLRRAPLPVPEPPDGVVTLSPTNQDKRPKSRTGGVKRKHKKGSKRVVRSASAGSRGGRGSSLRGKGSRTGSRTNNRKTDSTKQSKGGAGPGRRGRRAGLGWRLGHAIRQHRLREWEKDISDAESLETQTESDSSDEPAESFGHEQIFGEFAEGQVGLPGDMIAPGTNCETGLNRLLAACFHKLYASLEYKVRPFAPCYVSSLRTQVGLPDENTVELLMTAVVVHRCTHRHRFPHTRTNRSGVRSRSRSRSASPHQDPSLHHAPHQYRRRRCSKPQKWPKLPLPSSSPCKPEFNRFSTAPLDYHAHTMHQYAPTIVIQDAESGSCPASRRGSRHGSGSQASRRGSRPGSRARSKGETGSQARNRTASADSRPASSARPSTSEAPRDSSHLGESRPISRAASNDRIHDKQARREATERADSRAASRSPHSRSHEERGSESAPASRLARQEEAMDTPFPQPPSQHSLDHGAVEFPVRPSFAKRMASDPWGGAKRDKARIPDLKSAMSDNPACPELPVPHLLPACAWPQLSQYLTKLVGLYPPVPTKHSADAGTKEREKQDCHRISSLSLLPFGDPSLDPQLSYRVVSAPLTPQPAPKNVIGTVNPSVACAQAASMTSVKDGDVSTTTTTTTTTTTPVAKETPTGVRAPRPLPPPGSRREGVDENDPFHSDSDASSAEPAQSPAAADDVLVEDDTDRSFVSVTANSHLPGKRVLRYLGRVSVHLIKEWSVGKSGLGGFVHRFIAEAHLVVRALVAARQGNALLCFRHSHFMIDHDKHQTYCLISICGDAVLTT